MSHQQHQPVAQNMTHKNTMPLKTNRNPEEKTSSFNIVIVPRDSLPIIL